MDNALRDLIHADENAADSMKEIRKEIRFVDEQAGVIEVTAAEGNRSHTLKPLGELYGSGTGKSDVDPMDDAFLPLFLAIEEAIVNYYRFDRALTDGAVLLTLERLGMNPETDPVGDALARHLQLQLRLLLSLQDYSRQEVRAAMRRIAKSVARHTRLAGPRGYLSFIVGQLGGR